MRHQQRPRKKELGPWRSAAITGWGAYVPEQVLTNQDLERSVGTSDTWIRERTGIVERRLAGPGETTVSMCVAASRQALARARLAPWEIDLVVCATMTPDHLLPATGCLLQEQLGAVHAGAFDLNAACCGFLYGLSVAAQFIVSGQYERVLVAAGETLSRYVDWKDRSTCVLFGDGAGAVVLEAAEPGEGVLSTVLGCRGDVERRLVIEAGGSARPTSPETVAAGDHLIRMRGNEVFRLAVRRMVQVGKEALAEAGLTAAELRKVIPHQANARILEAAGEALGLPRDKLFLNVARYGNTGAASVPIALCEFLDAEPLRPDDHLLLLAFGGGLTWAASVLCWADVDALRAGRGEQPHTAGEEPSEKRSLQPHEAS